MSATLVFSGDDWLWPALGVFGVALAILAWSYSSARRAVGPFRWLCLLLKTLGVATLAFCLLEPMRQSQRAKPGANFFAIVADNSLGLAVREPGGSRTRGEALRDLLTATPSDWQHALDADFQTRRYWFDAQLVAARDFAGLTFDGRASALGRAFRTLAERYRGRPLAGVLLFTDGNATDLGREPPDLGGLPPVYPVVVGNPSPLPDLALEQVRVSQTAFEDAPVTIQADVQAAGYDGETIVARIQEAEGAALVEQTQTAGRDGRTLVFRANLKPTTNGVSFYQVRVFAQRENPDAAAGANPDSREATHANNQRVVAVDRGRGPYRILYVAGRPGWEYKFLNRAVAEDRELELVGLVRVANREPKFDFRGRAGETSNPLFRGFGNQSPEEIERYDQPVLIRLNTRDELELKNGFPRTAEELYAYRAVIVDDLEAAFFDPAQASLLERFVSERGGGFLMLGGMETFQEGRYARTPIGDLLPVYLDRHATPHPPAPVRLDLTPEGLLQPWARVRSSEADEKARLTAMAPFQVLNRIATVKPGASVIATATDDARNTWPALVVQRFGRGRSAALLIGDLWRWGLRDAPAHEDLDKTWRQLLRWLVVDVPDRVTLAAEPEAEDPNGAIRLAVRVRDATFQPLDDATVTLTVQPVHMAGNAGAATNVTALRAEPAPSEAGLYVATYVPRASGGFRATAVVTGPTGTEVGRADTGWASDLVADEFRSLQPNRPLLEAIARQTGGEIVPQSRLSEFVRALPRRLAPITETTAAPLWHTPALFLFALACLIAEWGLRRWKGLP